MSDRLDNFKFLLMTHKRIFNVSERNKIGHFPIKIINQFGCLGSGFYGSIMFRHRVKNPLVGNQYPHHERKKLLHEKDSTLTLKIETYFLVHPLFHIINGIENETKKNEKH